MRNRPQARLRMGGSARGGFGPKAHAVSRCGRFVGESSRWRASSSTPRLCTPRSSTTRENNEVVDILFGQGEWLDFLVEMGVMQTGALVVVVDDIPECLLRAVVKSKALSPARCACPVSWLRMSVKAAQRQLPPSEAQYTIVLAAPSSFQAPAPSGSPCNEQPSRSSAASGKLSHAAPAWLARFDQFQIDRGEPKNPDHRRLRRALLDTVIMRLVGDSPDKPPGRRRNSVVRIEIGPAVHPPRTGQHQTPPIGCIAVRRAAHVAGYHFIKTTYGPGLSSPP